MSWKASTYGGSFWALGDGDRTRVGVISVDVVSVGNIMIIGKGVSVGAGVLVGGSVSSVAVEVGVAGPTVTLLTDCVVFGGAFCVNWAMIV